MPNFFSVLLMLGILSVLIIVHEFGHFIVARFFGFQTPVAGIGLPFGPSWTIGERWGTQFKVHAMLLGGYVAIPELGDESNASEEAYGVPLKPFKKFPIWQRALVAVAGVTMNVIFAYFVMLVMVAMLGVPGDRVVVQSLAPTIPIAKEAGVLPGDEITAIDSLKVKTEGQVIDYFGQHKSTEVTLHILRRPEEIKSTTSEEPKGNPIDIKATTNSDGKLGMLLYRPNVKIDGNFVEIAGNAYTELQELTVQMVSTLGKMGHSILFGWMEHHEKGAAGGPGIGDLHGVLVVIKWGAELAQEDWTKLFTFTALISMDLAIVNLFPIPALDGGHLFFMLYEAIRGKPLDEKIHTSLVKWGFISLIALMALIMVNDVRALFSGELDFKAKLKKPGQKAPASDAKVNKEGATPDSKAIENGSKDTNSSPASGSEQTNSTAPAETNTAPTTANPAQTTTPTNTSAPTTP